MSTLKRSPTTATLVLLGLVFGLRLVLLASFVDGYAGVDGGAHRLSLLDVLGTEATGTDFTRPPLAPGWLLYPTTLLFGPVAGYNAFVLIFSMLLPLATWLAARALLPGWWAFTATGLVSLDPLLTGWWVMSVLPLIGYGLILMVCWGLWGLSSDAPGRRHWIAVACGIPLIAFTNQTSTGLAAIVFPLQWLVLPNKRRTAMAGALGVVFSLSALPWYLSDATPMSDKLRYPGPLIEVTGYGQINMWLAMVVLYVAWTVIRKAPPAPIAANALTASILALLQMFSSSNEAIWNLMLRATYLMLPFTWLIALWSVKHGRPLPRWGRRTKALASITAAVLVAICVQQFQARQLEAAVAHGDVLEAFERIPAGSDVVVNFYVTALYLAADRQATVKWTSFVAPPPFYEEDNLAARCTLGWVDGCGPAEGVTHVLVDEKWPLPPPWYIPEEKMWPYGAPERRPWHLLSDVPWLRLVGEWGDVKLYEVIH